MFVIRSTTACGFKFFSRSPSDFTEFINVHHIWSVGGISGRSKRQSLDVNHAINNKLQYSLYSKSLIRSVSSSLALFTGTAAVRVESAFTKPNRKTGVSSRLRYLSISGIFACFGLIGRLITLITTAVIKGIAGHHPP